VSARFDDPNLVWSGGLVPAMALAESAHLRGLAEERLGVPTDKCANAGLKVASLVAGMVAGADSIDDMALLRHGGMRRVFGHAYAPSTLGSFLRSFTFGHVRQLDAVASRFVTALAGRAPLVRQPADGKWLRESFHRGRPQPSTTNQPRLRPNQSSSCVSPCRSLEKALVNRSFGPSQPTEDTAPGQNRPAQPRRTALGTTSSSRLPGIPCATL
jgi:hypothetical protein